MRTFALFSFVVAFLAVAESSHAFENCSEDEVIARVCRPDPDLDARKDDTGLAHTLLELSAPTAGFTSAGTTVSVEAYDRFLRIFDHIVAAYRQLAEEMSPADRLWHKVRLSTLRPPTREELGENPINALLMGANGSYDWESDRIALTPVILNRMSLSEAEITMLIAHEIGHYLDPDAFAARNRPYKRSVRKNVLSDELNRCFAESFEHEDRWLGPTFEDYADWLASQVIYALIASAPSSDTIRRRALNATYAFCPNEGIYGHVASAVDTMTSGLDAHSPGRERILTLMRDPRMLDTIGCGPSILDPSTFLEEARCGIAR